MSYYLLGCTSLTNMYREKENGDIEFYLLDTWVHECYIDWAYAFYKGEAENLPNENNTR